MVRSTYNRSPPPPPECQSRRTLQQSAQPPLRAFQLAVVSSPTRPPCARVEVTSPSPDPGLLDSLGFASFCSVRACTCAQPGIRQRVVSSRCADAGAASPRAPITRSLSNEAAARACRCATSPKLLNQEPARAVSRNPTSSPCGPTLAPHPSGRRRTKTESTAEAPPTSAARQSGRIRKITDLRPAGGVGRARVAAARGGARAATVIFNQTTPRPRGEAGAIPARDEDRLKFHGGGASSRPAPRRAGVKQLTTRCSPP